MPKDINEKWSGISDKADSLPQAVDDVVRTTSPEDDPLRISVSDLFANDKAGAAKTLYSTDTGTSNIATAAINADASAITYSANGKFNHLGAGQSATDTFKYTIQMANGALSTANVTVNIVGTNDAATIAGDKAGSVTEDGTATAGGRLTVSDVDTGENVFGEVGSLDGDYGTFTFDNGSWGYTLNNAAAQALGADDSVTDSLTVKSKDGTASETITIAVAGVNDAATIAGDKAGSVTEDGTATAGGRLTVSDVDTGENVFGEVGSLDGDYGTFTFDNGSWGYTLNNAAAQALGADDSVTDSLTVKSKDGTASETITIAVAGVNDAATIAGDKAGSVTEDGTATAGGRLTVSDVDTGENVFGEVGSLDGDYGTFTFDNGSWGYTLNNAAAQALGADDSGTDSLTVKSKDGTASETINITVNGADEAPEKLTLKTTGSLSGQVYNYHFRDGSFYSYRDSDGNSYYYDYDELYNHQSPDAAWNFSWSDSPENSEYQYDLWTTMQESSWNGSYTGTDYIGRSYYYNGDYAFTFEQQSVMEFDLRGTPDTLAGATLKFDAVYGYSLPEAVEFRLYAGDGVISTADWDAGTIAASATLTQDHINQSAFYEVDLDPSVVSALGSKSYLGVNMSMADTLDTGENTIGLAFNGKSASLDLFIA